MRRGGREREEGSVFGGGGSRSTFYGSGVGDELRSPAERERRGAQPYTGRHLAPGERAHEKTEKKEKKERVHVLCVKNLSAQASAAQLVALFSRFERENAPPVLYRLLTGRMKGQAFVTLPDADTAQRALRLVHGYRLRGKPLVVEFGRERREEEKQTEEERK
ncbi:RNA-binding protein 41 [Liparis tanakae]|uniref:RNA-binding protein 41 n=1 Tax=Liparis tanakae TaxID=230148 RepID=A0A4Z2F9G0_9TELE|nr:RNA-binding protein 41 [Liparis tanakae]